METGTMLVEITGPKLDDFGRIQFFAYWPDDIRWRGGGLVAGQVFFTDPHEFIRKHEAGGLVVTVLNRERILPESA
jgi:hypothetical protein